MEYDLNIISRNMVPNNIYLCKRGNNMEWEAIHKYVFNNNLEFYIGSLSQKTKFFVIK